jgi:alpha-galactosidase
MRDALVAVQDKRTILFSLCDWGQADVLEWSAQTGNSWRMSGDISRKKRTALVLTRS